MKYFIIIVVCCLVAFSCENRHVSEQLEKADSLMVENPKEAYETLKAIDPNEVSGGKNKALYAMLYTEAQYKNYDSIKSDSLIDIAVEYYADRAEDPRQYRAFMYKGAALEDMGMRYEAMNWYKKAEEAIDSTDYRALGLVNIRIAQLYKSTFIDNDEQINRAKKALKCYLHTTDTLKLQYVYTLLGDMYTAKNIIDSAECYLTTGLKLKLGDADKIVLSADQLSLQFLYDRKGDHRKIIEHGLICIENNPSKNNYSLSTSLISRSYANIGKLDSALYYLKLFKEKNSLNNQLSEYMTLIEIEKCQGNYRKALEYEVVADKIADSVRKANNQHNLYQIDKQFDKQRVEVRNRELEYAANLRMALILIVGLALAVAVILIVIVVARSRRKSRELLELLDNLRAESTRSNNTLLDKLSKQSATEQALKIVLENKLKTVRELVELSYRYGSASASVFKTQFDKTLNTTNLDCGALSDLREIVNAKYYGLIDHIQSVHPDLNERDINLICLVCCKFSAIEMSVFFNYSNPKTIYSSKSRLCEKLNLEIGLDEYLESEIATLSGR